MSPVVARFGCFVSIYYARLLFEGQSAFPHISSVVIISCSSAWKAKKRVLRYDPNPFPAVALWLTTGLCSVSESLGTINDCG